MNTARKYVLKSSKSFNNDFTRFLLYKNHLRYDCYDFLYYIKGQIHNTDRVLVKSLVVKNEYRKKLCAKIIKNIQKWFHLFCLFGINNISKRISVILVTARLYSTHLVHWLIPIPVSQGFLLNFTYWVSKLTAVLFLYLTK